MSGNSYTLSGEVNYAPKVVKLPTPIKLDNLDNLVQVNLEGYSALIPKDSIEGSLWVLFPAECKLSADFAASRNLFSNAELNKDKTVKGYMDKSGRVRALKLRGIISDCLLLPAWEEDMKAGLLFDTINGVIISEKYEIPLKGETRNFTISPKHMNFPEHVDTLQYLRNIEGIPDNTEVFISQKLHGTSVRIGNILVDRKLSFLEKLFLRFKKLKVKVQTQEYAHVFGSRRVIKGISSIAQDFYGTDVHSTLGKKYADKIPEGFIVYGEIIGYVPDSTRPIQNNYTYYLQPKEAELFVYSVTVATPNGYIALNDKLMRDFCKRHELKTVPLLWRGLKKDINPDSWMDQKFYKSTYLEPAIPLCSSSPCDEGVVIRVDGINPTFYKLKGPKFYLHETKELDSGIAQEN